MRSTPNNLSQRIIAVLSNDVFLLVTSTIIILVATLYPFNFTIFDQLSLRELRESFENSSTIQDQVNNVLLFMPFGFAITSILQRHRINLMLQMLIVVILSAMLSTSVELLQTMLPSRSPTPADIINNSFGGLMGLISFYFWNSNHFERTINLITTSRLGDSRTKLFSILFGYICFASLLIMPWQGTSSLSDWSTDFPLVIGNEPTGNRPWQGYLSQLAITDQALETKQIQKIFANPTQIKNYQESLIGYYQFEPNQSFEQESNYNIFPDQTGNLPEFTWRGSTPSTTINNQHQGVRIDAKKWLETTEPTNILNQRLRDASQFTISTIVTSTNIDQTGPARIISLSRDSLYRNFTLGQEQENLEIRIRTPLTGQNGADIKLEVPQVFKHKNPHHIILTYNQAGLKVYVDSVENFYVFNLFERLPFDQKLFYYAITFIPLGFYLAFLATLAKRKIVFRNFMLPLGILLPSFLLEIALMHTSNKSLSLINLGLGILFTAGVPFLFKMRIKISHQ